MTTTTEAPAVNPHQPIATENALTCAAPDCGHAMHVYPIHIPAFKDQPEKQAAYWRDLFQRYHSGQYDTGRAPDISVDWEISACCSVCKDGIGDVKTNDSESVVCADCGTSWSMDGTNGERLEPEEGE